MAYPQMPATVRVIGLAGPRVAPLVAMLLACAVAFLAACAPTGEELLARAERELADGEYRAAMIDLRNYLARNPDDPRARVQFAAAMLELGDVSAAETEIGKARNLGAGREQTLVVDCRVMIARDAYQKVLDECTAAGPAAERAVDLSIVHGDALLGLKRYDEASASFESALKAQPQNLNALQGLAAAAFGADGIESARAVFAAAPKPVRARPRYWLAVGSLELRAGALEQAEKAFDAALERSASDPEGADSLAALAGLTEAQLRLNKLDAAKATGERLLAAAPRSPIAKLLAAQAAASGGDLVRSRELLEELVSADPGNLQARLLLGMVTLQQGNLGQAEMHLATVVARQPDNIRAQQLLAEVRSRIQSPEATLEALKPSLGQTRADPELLALASRLSMQSGNRDEALSYLAQAAESSREKSPEALLEIAGGYLAAGELDRAIELLENMPAGGASSLQRDSLLIAALLRQGKKQEATAKADALAAAAGSDAAARSVAAATYAAVGQREQARAQYEKALEVKPGDPGTLLSLARLELQDRNSDAAVKRLKPVLAADPKNLAAQLGMAAAARIDGDAKQAEEWIRRVAADHADSLQAMLAVAQFYLGNRDYGQAVQAAADAVRLAPESAAALNIRGLAQLGAGQSAAGIASLRAAVQKAPQSTGYRLNLGRALALQRDAAGALDAFDGALAIDGALQPALYLAATTALQAGQIERAAGYVERLRRVTPDSAAAMRIEGDLAMAQKRYRDAVSFYDKALATGGDTLLVGARYRAGKLAGEKDAAKVLQQWLARRPEDTTARILLAEDLDQKGDAAGAIREYQAVLERAPGNAVALNNLAILLQRRDDPRALDLARRAYAAAPASAAIQDTYGWLLVQGGELDRGLELLRSAARAMPALPDIQFHYGAALARKGLGSEAKPVLRQVMQSRAPAEVKAEAQRELARLDD
jgi:putative PEP-CTERM system TPR-repeat lipoprotein